MNKKALFTLSACLVGMWGNPSSASAAWDMPPTELSIFDNDASFPDIAANSFDRAIAIHGGDVVQASLFINGNWVAFPDLSTNFGNETRVAFDDSGTALAIWTDGSNSILTSHYNGTIWTTPGPNPLDTGSFFNSPAIAMNGSGGGISAWVDSTTFSIRTSTFFAGTWSLPITIGTGFDPSVGYSSNGSAIAGYDNFGTATVNNYIGGVWQAAIPLGSGSDVDVGIDSNGKAIAARLNLTGDVVVNYFNGATWSPDQTISTSTGNLNLSFAMAPNGTAVAVWIDSGFNLQSSSFNGTSWSAPFLVATGITIFGGPISVSVDANGNAVVGWVTDAPEIRGANLPVGTFAWIDNDLIADEDAPNGFSGLTTAISASGRSFAVWRLNGGEGGTIEGSFTILAPTPPLMIVGNNCYDKFASQTDRVNIITWTPSADPTVVSYIIRRNGRLLDTIKATNRCSYTFYDHNRCNHTSYVYTVTAINGEGVESTPVTVTVNVGSIPVTVTVNEPV